MRWVVATLAMAACGAPAQTPAPPPPAVSVAPSPSWLTRGPGGRDPIDVGTTDVAMLDATGCATCHAAIAAEWATSRHALAWTNGIFQREYQDKPKAWCVNCHAPMPAQQAELAGGRSVAAGGHALADQGINCATCHVRRGRIVAARRAPASPHDTIVAADFGSPAFCADCHQFTFPVLSRDGEAIRMTGHPMQDTVASFLRGPYASEPTGCMQCHGSANNHAFAGGHDPGMLGAALAVEWCRRGDAVEVTLTNVNAGHAVPTGDIHRHMNLRLWRSSTPEALYEGFLGRRFAPADDGGKTTTWDSSIEPGKHQLHRVTLAELGAPDDPAEPINLALIYVFIENEFPKPKRGPDEPITTTIVQWRMPPDEIPRCPL
jgi:hypothetical protein